MLRLAPAWLSGYAGVILLVTVLLNLSQMLARSGYGLTLPSMRDTLDLSYSQAGSLTAAVGILNMTATLIFGMLAARYGGRYIVGATSIASGLAMVLLGASPNFLVALFMSGLVGLTSGGTIVASMSLLLSWFESRRRGTVAGLAATGGGLSYLVVGAAVPWLTGRDPDDGWRHSWYLMAAITSATGILAMALLRDRPREAGLPGHGRRAWPLDAYKNRLIWLITLMAFLAGWCIGSYTTFFGVYLIEEGVDIVVSGRLWMVLGVLGAGSGVFWGNVSDRLGRRAGFLASFIFLAIGCLLFWITPVLAGFIASVILVGASFRAAYVICAAAAGDYVAPHLSPAAFGLMGMGAALGASLGPLLGGRIADVTGDIGWVFAISAILAGLAVVTSMFLRRPPLPA